MTGDPPELDGDFSLLPRSCACCAIAKAYRCPGPGASDVILCKAAWAFAKMLIFWLKKREHSTVNGVQLSVVDLLVLTHVDPHSCPRAVLGVVPCDCAADGAVLEPRSVRPKSRPLPLVGRPGASYLAWWLRAPSFSRVGDI